MRNLFPLLFLVLALAGRAQSDWPLPVTTPAAAGFSAERLDTLHRNLAAEVDAGRYAGYSVVLAREGRIVDWRTHGWRDVAAGQPFERDTIVRIFSMSKIVTSVAALILLDDGRLKLTDPVEKFLPVLRDRTVLVGGTADAPELVPAARRITVRDLLRHTTGYYYPATWSADSPVALELLRRAEVMNAPGLDEFVARLARLPLHDQPGTRFRYGLNTDLLGAVIAQASGQPLEQFLAERIFRPLDMRDTGFDLSAEQRTRLARVHHRDKSGALVPSQTLLGFTIDAPRTYPAGGSGLFSTAGDYLRFAQMLLNGGELDGRRVLSRKAVELMTRNHLTDLASPHPFGQRWRGFGLGVAVLTDLGASAVLGSTGAYGWDGAATTLIQIDPQERTVALLLTQHLPFNQDDIFATFSNGWYAALED